MRAAGPDIGSWPCHDPCPSPDGDGTAGRHRNRGRTDGVGGEVGSQQRGAVADDDGVPQVGAGGVRAVGGGGPAQIERRRACIAARVREPCLHHAKLRPRAERAAVERDVARVLVSADSGPGGNVSFKRVTALISAETHR